MNAESMRWVKEIVIDLETCKGCKNCMNACFVDVIRWNDEAKKPVVAYPEDCVWCLACEAACPVDAIEVIPVIPAPLKTSF
ncbi:MAG: ferredoxin family protein [Dehalococcoidales bacterium]|nr:ferredoxin family protein [Dehalococcoidales bacterium]